ncbi:hypothetical protein [Herbaspirillum huttiense]|uniref:hypothetical protein n=1 Tax=Herbaspirillum huttiense TaxID=863372 RepID=UPI0039AF6995
MAQALFDFNEVPMQKRCRWFVRHGATTKFDRGFRAKADADNWINAMRSRIEWRAGFVFRLEGDSVDMSIVDRSGKVATP